MYLQNEYTRTEAHRDLLREQVKDNPNFTTKEWIPSEEVREKISKATTGKPKNKKP